jgi:hypothetical protein
MLSHVAIGGAKVTQFVRLPPAQRGNFDFELAKAIGI